MKRTGAFLLAVAAASLSQDSSSCHAQDYGSYGQEENYADYADTQDDLYLGTPTMLPSSRRKPLELEGEFIF